MRSMISRVFGRISIKYGEEVIIMAPPGAVEVPSIDIDVPVIHIPAPPAPPAAPEPPGMMVAPPPAPGAPTIPTIIIDGEVIDGRSVVDESMITGESIPVEKDAGDSVIGGTLTTSTFERFRLPR